MHDDTFTTADVNVIRQVVREELAWNKGYMAGMQKALSYILSNKDKTVDDLIEQIKAELNDEF